MLHIRITAPPEMTSDVVEVLSSDPAVSGML
jgi:hypothetical protein